MADGSVVVIRPGLALFVASLHLAVFFGACAGGLVAYLSQSGGLAISAAIIAAGWLIYRSIRSEVVVASEQIVIVNRFRTARLPEIGTSFDLVDLSLLKPSAKVVSAVHGRRKVKIEASVAFTAKRRDLVASRLAQAFGECRAFSEYGRAEL